MILSVYCPSRGQETNYGPGYQTILVNNPAYSGSAGKSTIKLSYLNFYPGHNYNFHSVYFSFDSYFPVLHGGAGIYISDDYMGGILNDMRGGLSYSYFLQAGKELYINAGLSASFLHRGFNFNGAILPEQIDQMGGISLPPSEILVSESRSVIDVGTGIVFIYRNIFGGLGITHLAQPGVGIAGSSVDRIRRKYFINIAADFGLDASRNLIIRPVASTELQADYFSVSVGAAIESRYLSINSLLFFNNYRNVDIQAGFSLGLERLEIFYNYKFSLKSGDALMPFSLMHQTGLNFSLNNVEKRIRARTINMPRL